MGALLGRLGYERGEMALRRLALCFPDEDKTVIACRAERLAAGWERAIAMLGSIFGER
jgi:hypothetical protein